MFRTISNKNKLSVLLFSLVPLPCSSINFRAWGLRFQLQGFKLLICLGVPFHSLVLKIQNWRSKVANLMMSDSELEDKVFSLFKNFMAGIAKFEELVPMGSTFLNSFQHALEFLRRPPINKTSQLVKNIIQSNETKRVKSYIEAGCINTDDEVQSCQLGLHDHIRKGKCILNKLECLLEDVRGAMQDISLFQDDNLGERLNEQACINDKEEFALPCPRRNEVSDYAVLMAVIYSMVTQEYMMQERVVSALSLKLSSGELDSYSLMWSLRPYIDEEIMGHAWKLIRCNVRGS